MPRSTLTWKKYIWKFNCSTSRPFQKGSVYKVLPIFEVCIFISKTELWKNTAPARRSCLLAHVEPFFHFQNSVGDHIYIYQKLRFRKQHVVELFSKSVIMPDMPLAFNRRHVFFRQRFSNARPFSVWGVLCWLVVWNIFYFFPSIGNNNPNWLIFFRGVETTSQFFRFRTTLKRSSMSEVQLRKGDSSPEGPAPKLSWTFSQDDCNGS